MPRILAGGGAVPSLEGLGAVEGEAARRIQERCPAEEYWLAAGGVRITRRD